MSTPPSTWTANQRTARERIINAAADLIGREGLGACTLRAVAEEAALKKSTVHYYFDDANELVDLSVAELFRRFADEAAKAVADTAKAADALAYLVRLFMGRAGTPPPFRDPGLWPEYVAHALKRGAHVQIRQQLELFRVVFEVALRRTKLDTQLDKATLLARSAAVHDLMLGAMVRNMVQPIPRAQIARSVSAISGVKLDPDRC